MDTARKVCQVFSMVDKKRLIKILNAHIGRGKTFASIPALAEAVGMSHGTLYAWINSPAVPRMSNVRAVLEALGVDQSEVLVQPKVVQIQENKDTSGEGLVKHVAERMLGYDSEYIQVPFLEARAAAGHGVDVQHGLRSYLAFRRDWLSSVTRSPDELMVLGVEGDSMLPLLSEKDVVLVDASRGWERFSGRLYVVAVDGRVKVKRVLFDHKALELFKEEIQCNERERELIGAFDRGEEIGPPDLDDLWRRNFKPVALVSEDPEAYPPEFITNDVYFEVLGRVLWAGRELLTA